MNRVGPTIRSRLLRVLRRLRSPRHTGDLARMCAAGHPRASAVTLTVLLALERAGVVKRWPRVLGGRGRGRPAYRWTLARHDQGRAA